jgi:hypothetical protein
VEKFMEIQDNNPVIYNIRHVTLHEDMSHAPPAGDGGAWKTTEEIALIIGFYNKFLSIREHPCVSVSEYIRD